MTQLLLIELIGKGTANHVVSESRLITSVRTGTLRATKTKRKRRLGIHCGTNSNLRSLENVFHLDLCEGGSGPDGACKAGLECFHRVNSEPVPGCSNTEPDIDYCFDPYNNESSSTGSGNDEVGALFLCLRFSLIREPPLKAKSVERGRESQLVQTISNVLLEVLCNDTDFRVVLMGDADVSKEQRSNDYCAPFRTKLDNEWEESIASSLVSKAHELEVVDVTMNSMLWTEWAFQYLVLQVGQDYLEDARNFSDLKNSGDNITILEGLERMQLEADRALNASIQDKKFDTLVGDGVITSLIGQELITFPDEETDSLYLREKGRRLRIAGSIMLAWLTVFTFFLYHQQIKRLRSNCIPFQCGSQDPTERA